MLRLALAASLASVVVGDRVNFQAEISEHNLLAAPFDGVARWGIDINATCKDCISVFQPLFAGINAMGFLEGSSWEKETGRLTVNLTREYVYGEFPSRSKVPILISLGPNQVTLTFTYTATTKATQARVTGMHTKPPAQAMKLYKAYAATCTASGKSCGESCNTPAMPAEETQDTLLGCIKDEVDAAGRWIANNWDNSSTPKDFKGEDFKGKKIGMILSDVYNTAGMNTLLAMSGGSWKSIFYSLTTTCPLTFGSWTFDVHSSGTPQVYASSGPLIHPDPAVDECNKYGLYEKAVRYGLASLLQNGAFQINAGKSKAKSGINFAMMMAFGNPEVKKRLEVLGGWMSGGMVTGADAKDLGKMFTLCVKGGKKYGADPPCNKDDSDAGRIGWFADFAADSLFT